MPTQTRAPPSQLCARFQNKTAIAQDPSDSTENGAGGGGGGQMKKKKKKKGADIFDKGWQPKTGTAPVVPLAKRDLVSCSSGTAK